MKNKTSSISSEKSMISCFSRRKDGIKKKAWELSVLCDIKACAIIIGPDGNIETWPVKSSGVLDVVTEFKNSGAFKPSPGRSAAVSGKTQQKIEKQEYEDKKEEAYHHIPNVSEFDAWVNSNWCDRTFDEPKRPESGLLQMLMDADSEQSQLVGNQSMRV